MVTVTREIRLTREDANVLLGFLGSVYAERRSYICAKTLENVIVKLQQRCSKMIVLDSLRELEKDSNEPVQEQDIVTRTRLYYLTELETLEALAELKIDGQVYDPGLDDKYRIV